MIRRLFFSAALLLSLAAPALAGSSSTQEAVSKQFTDHTFVYIDPVSKLETYIYLGRFGTFDRYVPCEFQDGLWSVTDDGKVCIIENDETIPPACYTPRTRNGAVTFLKPGGEVAFISKLQKGFRLPFG
ncbi:MAG: hypothetical protein OEY85_01340 [Rhodospirillales bacterium]|nr:hypothetical protein [Rhodospirillales bacterium]